jgi:RNA polymerase sigma-70 factor (ECF subfamily)
MHDPTTTFDRLLERHRAEITAYLRRLLGDPSAAEDVAQDTWLRAHRAYGRLPRDANARAWLYRIATNRALTALRQRRTGMRRSSAVELDVLPARHVDLDARLTLQAVARAVERLPPKQRAALVARRFHDLGYDEIGVSLGCSAESARANVHQAMRKLRTWLEQT